MHSQNVGKQQFQSTPPRRRRLFRQGYAVDNLDFNPRLREGGDAFHSLFIPANVISIHASAKEATSSFS